MYGTQALNHIRKINHPFENDVKMYGTQACVIVLVPCPMFENDVKMYGTQAKGGQSPLW